MHGIVDVSLKVIEGRVDFGMAWWKFKTCVGPDAVRALPLVQIHQLWGKQSSRPARPLVQPFQPPTHQPTRWPSTIKHPTRPSVFCATGGALSADAAKNAACYGEGVTSRAILSGSVAPPPQLQPLYGRLSELASN